MASVTVCFKILLFSQNFPLPRQGFGSSDPTDHPVIGSVPAGRGFPTSSATSTVEENFGLSAFICANQR
jgi:hypothetical protein